MTNQNIPDNVDDKLGSVKYKPSECPHLTPNQELCAKCDKKECTFFCPANVYEWSEEQNKLIVNYENCLECGACRIACPNQAVGWVYPESGSGVTFKFG